MPWSLAGVMCKIRSKDALVHKIEKGILPLEQLPQGHAAIIDGIAVAQQFIAARLTFGQLAEDMLQLELT